MCGFKYIIEPSTTPRHSDSTDNASGFIPKVSGRILTATPNIIIEIFSDFPQSLQSNTGIIHEGSFR